MAREIETSAKKLRHPRFRIDSHRFPHNHYPVLKAFYRVPAVKLAPKLSSWGLSADTVSWMSFGFGLLGAVAFSSGVPFGLLGGLVCLHFSLLLDYADGEVARLDGTSSVHGAWLEVGLDKIQFLAVVVGLTVGASTASPAGAWGAAFASATAFLYAQGLMIHRRRLIKDPLEDLRVQISNSGDLEPPDAPGTAGGSLRVWAVAIWRETALNYVTWLWLIGAVMLMAGPFEALLASAVYGWGRALMDLLVGHQRATAIDRARHTVAEVIVAAAEVPCGRGRDRDVEDPEGVGSPLETVGVPGGDATQRPE